MLLALAKAESPWAARVGAGFDQSRNRAGAIGRSRRAIAGHAADRDRRPACTSRRHRIRKRRSFPYLCAKRRRCRPSASMAPVSGTGSSAFPGRFFEADGNGLARGRSRITQSGPTHGSARTMAAWAHLRDCGTGTRSQPGRYHQPRLATNSGNFIGGECAQGFSRTLPSPPDLEDNRGSDFITGGIDNGHDVIATHDPEQHVHAAAHLAYHVLEFVPALNRVLGVLDTLLGELPQYSYFAIFPLLRCVELWTGMGPGRIIHPAIGKRIWTRTGSLQS